MRFGPVATAEALGTTLAHSVAFPGRVLRKGTVLTADDVAALAAAGIGEVVVAAFAPDDVGEDAAAARIAAVIAGRGVRCDVPFTGRVNLFAETGGVLVVDKAAVDRLNRIDERVTLATLADLASVEAGRMVATVKIIPFAVPAKVLAEAEAAAGGALVRIAPFRALRIGFVQTITSSVPGKVLDKTARVTAQRVNAMNSALDAERRVPHAVGPLTHAIRDALAAGSEIVLVFGASAIADRRDVIPTAIEEAGGRVEHLGMPVDPGNLILLGSVGDVPVIGAPGCARSPKENGFDWVLARLVAGLPVTRDDVMGLGVGGLLMEIASRPQPRAEAPAAPHAPRIAGVVLAAGRSTRMGGPNKLLEDLSGKPVVRHAVEAAAGAGLAPIVVVTGHMAREVQAALADLPVRFVHNPDYAQGLSSSLATGVGALDEAVDGALVALGDMPGVTPELIGALTAAFAPEKGRAIVVPTAGGRRGNPVLWARRFFTDLTTISGDVGARHLLGAHAEVVAEVPVVGEGALVDVDTPEALAAARARQT